MQDVEIRVDGFGLKKIFEPSEGLRRKIVSHFTKHSFLQIMNLIGGLDIIGNPTNLFRNVGTGVIELFEKPIEGFVKGPLEGLIGIGKGFGSLGKGLVIGIFGSVESLTSACGNLFASASVDPYYVNRRALRKTSKKAKHLFAGIWYGISELGIGIIEGGSSIFVNPIMGAHREGAKGFFKGTLQCTLGVVAKPLAGAFDCVSRTAEGITNSVTYYDDKSNTERVRTPRVSFLTAEK